MRTHHLKAEGNGGNTNEQMGRVCANIVPRAVVLVAWVAEAGDEPGCVLHRPRRGVGDGGDDGDQARTADAAEWCRDAPAGRVGGGEEGCGEVSGGGGSGRGEQRHGGRAGERRRRRRRRRWRRRRTEAIGAGQRASAAEAGRFLDCGLSLFSDY